MKKILGVMIGLFLCLPFLCLQPLYAATPEENVEALLKSKIDAVVQMLKQDRTNPEARNKKIMEIIDPAIDFELMAKLALGRNLWEKLSPSQQHEFVTLFVGRLKSSYLEKSDFYADDQIVYGKAIAVGDKIQAPVKVVTGDKPVEMLYKFYHSSSGWRVYDVEINGVSLIRSYRMQFQEILQNGTVEDLMRELKQKEGRIE